MPCPTPRYVVAYGRTLETGCRNRACPHCGEVWAQDTRIRALAAAEHLPGAVALLTVTAPGRDVLPWAPDGRLCAAGPLRSWNQQAPAAWSRMHRAARAEMLRRVPAARGAWELSFKAWEFQRRGALHLHLVVPFHGDVQRRASQAYASALRRLAPTYGFGFVDCGKLPERGARQSSRRLRPAPPGRAASYVAAYVAGTSHGKGGVAEVARSAGCPGAVLYASSKLTRASGVTMRSLRCRRRVSCLSPQSRSSSIAWRAGCLVDALDRGRPPLTPAARGALLRRAIAAGWTGWVVVGTGECLSPTQAPPPPALSAETAAAEPPPRWARVRLDSVLHRGHEDAEPDAWQTVATVE